MGDKPAGMLTQILNAVRDGDQKAAAELLPLVYGELRQLARARMAKTPPGQTLQPTALVHEAYLRLIGADDPGWNSRGHFFAAAGQAMRQILVDQARRKCSLKRGGGRQRLDVDDVEPAIESPSDDILALEEVVNLRYFAGLTVEETAAALDISVTTVEREWRFARVRLYDELTGQSGESSRRDADE